MEQGVRAAVEFTCFPSSIHCRESSGQYQWVSVPLNELKEQPKSAELTGGEKRKKKNVEEEEWGKKRSASGRLFQSSVKRNS